jgi:hypothetical protein
VALEKFASDAADDFLPGSIDSPLVGSSSSAAGNRKRCRVNLEIDAAHMTEAGAISSGLLICKSNSGLDRDRIAKSPSPGPIRALVTILG